MHITGCLIIGLVLSIFEKIRTEFCDICDLKDHKIESAFTFEQTQNAYLICGNTVWIYDYKYKNLENFINFKDLFIDKSDPSFIIDKPDAVFTIGRVNMNTSLNKEEKKNSKNLTVVFLGNKYYLFRPNNDGKFYRQHTNYGVPKALVPSGGPISHWTKDKVQKVVEALYIGPEYRIYLFTTPSNATHYPYYYNENSNDDIRTYRKAFSVQFDAVFHHFNSRATFIRGNTYCTLNVVPQRFLTSEFECRWTPLKDVKFPLFKNCPVISSTTKQSHTSPIKPTFTPKNITTDSIERLTSPNTMDTVFTDSNTGQEEMDNIQQDNHFMTFLFVFLFLVLFLAIFTTFVLVIAIVNRKKSSSLTRKQFMISNIGINDTNNASSVATIDSNSGKKVINSNVNYF